MIVPVDGNQAEEAAFLTLRRSKDFYLVAPAALDANCLLA
jgi:hypothetical protein